MHGGNKTNTAGSKPGQSTSCEYSSDTTKCKVGFNKGKTPKKGRTHSQLSNDSHNDSNISNNMFDLDFSGLENLQRDIQDIKSNLQGVTKISDLNEATKDLVRSSDLEAVVVNIVNKLLNNYERKIEEKFDIEIAKVKTEMQEKIDALLLENETMKQQLEIVKQQTSKVRIDSNRVENMTRHALTRTNYNEQYSRKNNIKVFNMKWKEKQNLREDFIELVKNDLNVELNPRDVVAIHRIPSSKPGDKPVIVRLFSSDVKKKVMREKKNLKNRLVFIDDITKQNYELMKRLRESHRFESVWYFNSSVYVRTNEHLQLKFDFYDDIDLRIRQGH